jgi:hypothetical protein
MDGQAEQQRLCLRAATLGHGYTLLEQDEPSKQTDLDRSGPDGVRVAVEAVCSDPVSNGAHATPCPSSWSRSPCDAVRESSSRERARARILA